MLKDKISLIIKDALRRAVENQSVGALTQLNDQTLNNIIIEKTKKAEFGDYSCNISCLAREAKLAPPKIAQAIADNISQEYKNFATASIVGGFINFTLTDDSLNVVISEILGTKENFGKNNQGQNLKVLLEYVSANPTGPLHIGHGRWAALGSCIQNIMNFTGYDVTTEFYINDAGSQIRNLGYSLFLRVLQQFDESVYFPLDKETDPRAAGFYPGDYLIDIAKQFINENPGKAEDYKEKSTIDNNLYVPPEEVITEMSEFAKPIILEQQKQLLERFKTTFKIWYSETALHKSGKVDSILDSLQEKGALYEKDGAMWFASSRFGDEQDRVIRKSDGLLTYLTADIAYHKDKYERGFEHLINIWGADHHGYVARMKAAVEAMGYNPDSLEVLLGQMVNLIIGGEQVRMGKRKKMLTLEDLINDVGVDATRFWMVTRSTDTTLDFDVDLAKSTSDENPVYYVQYAHARCCSIFRTAVSERPDVENNQNLPALYTQSELDNLMNEIKNNTGRLSHLWDNVDEKQKLATRGLILNLESFKDVVSKASRDRAPHYLARYLIDLASCFHSFYNECRVLSLNPALSMSQELQDARLSLINATRQLLSNGLNLLGVKAPQAM